MKCVRQETWAEEHLSPESYRDPAGHTPPDDTDQFQDPISFQKIPVDALWIMDEVGEVPESYCPGPALTLHYSKWEGRRCPASSKQAGRQAGRCRQQGAWVRGGVGPQGNTSLGNTSAGCSPSSPHLPHPTPAFPPGPAGTGSCSSGAGWTRFASKTKPLYLRGKKGVGWRGGHGCDNEKQR